LEISSNEDIQKQGITYIPFGFIGPDLSDNLLAEAKKWEKKFIRIADNSAKDLKSFICGNNIKDEHKIFYNWGLINSRNAVRVLMSIELMLNGVNINLMAFSSYIDGNIIRGQVFTVFVITVAAAEAAVGLAILLSLYRNRTTVDMESFNLLKW